MVIKGARCDPMPTNLCCPTAQLSRRERPRQKEDPSKRAHRPRVLAQELVTLSRPLRLQAKGA